MLLNPGKYVSKVGKLNGNGIVIYETEARGDIPGGALCAAIPCEVAEGDDAGKTIKHTVTIVTKDGTIQTRTCDTLKEVFGWDGVDPFWLMDADMSQVRFEIVVEADKNDKGEFSKVKYLNALGGSVKMPAPGDRKSILAKYGSQFRALAGGAPAIAKPAQSAAPKPPTAPKKSTPPPPQTGPTATMEEAWAACWEASGSNETAAHEAWDQTMSAMFPGKTNSDLTPHDWGKLKEKFADNVPA